MTVIAGQRADHYRTPDELAGFLPRVLSAPKDLGTLDLVVRRPGRGVREVLDEGELSVSHGLVGDNWIERVTDGPDGPNPDDQLNVMNSRLVEFLAGDPELRQLAGDQLYLDLDLSAENLPAGTRLVIGDPDVRGAVIEVTALPHTGCQQLWSDLVPPPCASSTGRSAARCGCAGCAPKSCRQASSDLATPFGSSDPPEPQFSGSPAGRQVDTAGELVDIQRGGVLPVDPVADRSSLS